MHFTIAVSLEMSDEPYFFGVGVEKDEKKGWDMLMALKDKGNQPAANLINELLSKGYKAPGTELKSSMLLSK